MSGRWINLCAAIIIAGQAWAQTLPSQPMAGGGPVAVLLQKGIYQEETAGDLPAAAQTYRQVIAEGAGNRQYIAQAMYRLGVVSLKQKQAKDAFEAFGQLKSQYPEQKELVAKSEAQLADARTNLGADEVRQLVDDAVARVSTMAESDPRLPTTLATLEGLNDTMAVNALISQLHSDTPEVRRAAIYILYKGPAKDIGPAVPELEKLLDHEEVFTRGMAALALGTRKVEGDYEKIVRLTKDSSAYIRRCAVLALAEYDKPEGKAIVERIAKEDKDEVVQLLAKKMLESHWLKSADAIAPRIVHFTPAMGASDVDPKLDRLAVTFNQTMRDKSWAWVQRYPEMYPKTQGRPRYDPTMSTCMLPVRLEPGKVYWIEFNSPPFIGFRSEGGRAAVRQALVFATAGADGKPTPIPEELTKQAAEINAESAASPGDNRPVTAPGARRGAAAPEVIKSQPATLADDVDPALGKITVTFDRAMKNGSWSWTGGGETFPEVTGKISYDAKQTTCTLPVKIQPGRVYCIGINSPSHRNFRSVDGQPAQPYLIVFATRSADGKPTPIPAELVEAAEGINASVGNGEPLVMKTNPTAMANDVRATQTQITVTFDQQMLNGSWSWCGGGDTYPQLTGKPSYDVSRTTCTLPVKLDSGKVYWVGINSPSYQNFQNRANTPARRYVILFATAGADGKATPIPENMRKEAAEINAQTDNAAPTSRAAKAIAPTRQDKMDAEAKAGLEKAKVAPVAGKGALK